MAKRIYIKGAPYLLTSNTKKRVAYFQEDIFCNILIDVIAECQKIKPFNLLSFKINPDHFHIILQPIGKFNISQIMHSIKRVSALHINKIIYSPFPDSPHDKYEWTPSLKFYKRCFQRKYNYKGTHPYPSFDWQEGFDDQLIRTSNELNDRNLYIDRQAMKHKLPENKFLYFNTDIPLDIIFIGVKNNPN